MAIAAWSATFHIFVSSRDEVKWKGLSKEMAAVQEGEGAIYR
jgi:hypothetical protein